MQVERSEWEGIREMLDAVRIPQMFLVEQKITTPEPVPDIERAVRDALSEIEMPSGSVAIGVGSRGVARIGDVVKALVAVLKESGASPFVIPAMGSHGASTAEGQAEVLAHLGVSEETVGCPVRATMETVEVGRTPAGVPVHMDKNAYEEADAIVVVNRVKPHTAFRGTVESGPTKMLAIGFGKQRGAHHIHRAGWGKIHETIPEAARVMVETGKVAFGLATLENADEEPCRIAAIPADKFEEVEAGLLEEAKKNLLRLPFDRIDVLVVDEIGKNISGDGADPNITGRYPTPYISGGPEIERIVYLGLTPETEGNANGVGMADVVTEKLASQMNRQAGYMNALTSTTPIMVKVPMTVPTERDAVAAALEMCAGVEPEDAKIVHIKNTLSMRRMWVSEPLIEESKIELDVIEGPKPMELR